MHYVENELGSLEVINILGFSYFLNNKITYDSYQEKQLSSCSKEAFFFSWLIADLLPGCFCNFLMLL